jgi:predicted nucleic-acid-binding protein
MESYHLDTSALIRLLVQEPRDSYVTISVFLEKKLMNGAFVFVSDLVLAEAYFAMQSFYQFTKVMAVEMLARFVLTPGIHVTPHALEILSMPNLARAKPGFVNRLIHGEAVEAGQTLLTFEKAAKSHTATVVLGDG